MFTISNQTDYALLIIEYLSKQKTHIPLSLIINHLTIPKRFASRIASILVKHRILKSREGIYGGYTLAKSLDAIKLYDILTIFEGDAAFAKCADSHYLCRFQSVCQHSSFLKETLKTKYLALIKDLTIKETINHADA